MAEKTTTRKSKSTSWTFGTGRRKTSIARVAIKKGGKELVVNEMPFDSYFTDPLARARLSAPLRLLDRENEFDISIKLVGGGMKSQIGAVVHGLANALVAYDDTMRVSLAKEGYMTRDPRAKERRKYGHAGRARAMKQSPKR
jgi:small subunit ribosomal protein S9